MNRLALTASLSALTLAAGLSVAVAASGERAPAPAAAAARADQPYSIDAVHSSVVFAIKHSGLNDVWGRFNVVTGTFAIDPASSKADVDISVDIDSIDTNNGARDKHLKTADFFSAKEFPKATFKSTKLAKNGEAWELSGEFTLHGVTKAVTAALDWRGTGQGREGPTAGFVATLKIKRSEFGMTKYLDNLGDEVHLTVSVQGGAK